MSRRILAVVAHPDDEVLGCGGTLCLHARRGDEVHVRVVADGESSRLDGADEHRASRIEARERSARAAARVLGVESIAFMRLPDNRLDSVSRLELTTLVEQCLVEIKPETVYTHHCGDLNVDHRQVHDAVVTACRPKDGSQPDTLLFFEIPSSTEWQTAGSGPAFVPNIFVDIASVQEQKRSALTAYEAELRPWPHARSLEAVDALARWRGATVGVPLAEAFMLGRKIIRE